MRQSTERSWILGAPDPEMAAIEDLLTKCGERFAFAAAAGGRVAPGSAYRATSILHTPESGELLYLEVGGRGLILVECGFADPPGRGLEEAIIVDHHRPGDPGTDKPPGQFLAGSSLGQAMLLLARFGALPDEWRTAEMADSEPARARFEPRAIYVPSIDGWIIRCGTDRWAVPRRLAMAAAADHCLGAAYRGECPGIDPKWLYLWRTQSRAEFQGISAQALKTTVSATVKAVKACSRFTLGDLPVVDVAGSVQEGTLPELPEALMVLDLCGLARVRGPGPDGAMRDKLVLLNAQPEQVIAFKDKLSVEWGLEDVYGVPGRGFAGGYIPVGA